MRDDAWIEYDGPTIRIKGPLSHQDPVDRSPASRKLLRWGRRAGKTRWAFKAGIVGHGPNVQRQGRTEPLHRGVVHGFDIMWIARDIPQGRTIWHEEIRPRFRGLEPHVSVNEQEKRVEFKDGGRLWIRTAENIDSVRGAGDSLIGVIVDEAAYLDLQTALREVVLPVLVDNEGWLVLMSTTNSGPDGFEDEGGKRTPSYFNLLCEEVRDGDRSGNWQEFYATAFDNPVLPAAAIDELIEEYPEDSIELAQEVYAKLVVGGAGLAFPEWDDTVHVTDFRPERTHETYRWAAGMDWGYAKPGAFILFASGAEREIARWEFYFKGMDPYDVGYTIGQRIQSFPRPEYISLDAAAFAVTDGGPTPAERIQQGLRDAVGTPDLTPPVVASPKGSGSRVAGKLLVHERLKYTRGEDGEVKPWHRPKLLVHKDCPNGLRTLPKLMKDEKNPEDVETNSEDHWYDALRYYLMARSPYVEREKVEHRNVNKHPGLRKDGSRHRPDRDLVEVGPTPGHRTPERWRPGQQGGDAEW